MLPPTGLDGRPKKNGRFDLNLPLGNVPRRNVILSLLLPATPCYQINYWAEPEFELAAAVAADFGTLKYPVAVDLLTLLMTSSTAWRVPPV